MQRDRVGALASGYSSTEKIEMGIIALGGVQKFIVESRTTRDVANASLLLQELAWVAAEEVTENEGYRVFPSPKMVDSASVTNKIIYLCNVGQGASIAEKCVEKMTQLWQNKLAEVFVEDTPIKTPGFPDISWITVEGSAGNYADLWQAAQRALTARKRSKVFDPFIEKQVVLCSQSAGLPAIPAAKIRLLQRYESDENLSAAGWVKRKNTKGKFSSTRAVASAAFLAKLEQTENKDLGKALTSPVNQLEEVIAVLNDSGATPSAGSRTSFANCADWLYPELWRVETLAKEYEGINDKLVAKGREASKEILKLAKIHINLDLSPYYAIIAQDIDRLGQALNSWTLNEQSEAAFQLYELAQEQKKIARKSEFCSSVIYSGGDDFLAFSPASTALSLAETLRKSLAEHVDKNMLWQKANKGKGVTASTAIVFVHMSYPLRLALESVREALNEAKNAQISPTQNRDALAVIAIRRGGERARTVQPWNINSDGGNAADLLRAVSPSGANALSPRLAADIEANNKEMQSLAAEDNPDLWDTLKAEIHRLTIRHGGSDLSAKSLVKLAEQERSNGKFLQPLPAVLIARFLSQECQ
ncbi:MAG: Cas10/Cmr2 second palm domain-containing protein [Mycobacteriaceae bacterium]